MKIDFVFGVNQYEAHFTKNVWLIFDYKPKLATKDKKVYKYFNETIKPRVEREMGEKESFKNVGVSIFDSNNKLVETFKSQTDCAKFLNVSRQAIFNGIKFEKKIKGYQIKEQI